MNLYAAKPPSLETPWEIMLDLLSCALPELESWLAEHGEPRFRARQVYDWLYRRLETDPQKMSTLPGSLRATLAQEATTGQLTLRREQVSKDGRTRKLLLALGDGRLIESVLMLFPATAEGRARATACISTQVGCALGCTFCATGQMGFERHLTAGEIVGQVLYLARELRDHPWMAPDGQVLDRLTNLVLMGMGEPLHNYDQMLKAVKMLNSPEGFGLGARHITISTVGLVPGILRLSEEALQINLAISLHAPNNEMRSRTMPVARKYNMDELLAACRTYMQRTNRQVTFEYVLLAGVNDAPEHARELGQRLAEFKQLAHVNLIPVNATSADYHPPTGEAIRAFRDELRRAGISNSVRAERGDDIAAACGQLKTKEQAKKPALARA
ncbi:MAG TPA: 23S rRNA (adenine(2503)-C(2))-methyltransferase RlmN [Ktedonobacterales bacterium]|nr:23S rRNA (adenine(2503)-C(2))-methyltransferase RlmN [Ktedonobacterales bacterium]